MSRILQVGAGSGGIVVLDAVARDPRVHHVDLIEPDTYSAANVHRHLFPESSIGRLKCDAAADWLRERRVDLSVNAIPADITDPLRREEFLRLAGQCDVGICAADNEAAKFAFDSLMRSVGKPWTLGEVLSGGIGGWVHRFEPGGACYGCVASHLQRNIAEEPSAPPPNYSDPNAAHAEARIPASKAAIGAIANLHAAITLELLDPSPQPAPRGGEGEQGQTPPTLAGKGAGGLGFSLLFSLARVPGVFDEAFRTFRFRIPKSAACLICSAIPAPAPGEDLDAALDRALARLGHD